MDPIDSDRLVQRIQEFTDLELAMLLCFVAGEHCIIEAEPDVKELLEIDIRCVR